MRLGWMFSIRRGHLAVNSGLSILRKPASTRSPMPRAASSASSRASKSSGPIYSASTPAFCARSRA